MHPNVKRGGIEPPLLTAYQSQRCPSGQRGASGVFAKPVKSKPKKKPLRQGDCVETPTGEKGIVMLVSPLGDCYVEVGGSPFIFLQADLTRLPISVISPELTLRQIYIELHAYRKALALTSDEKTRASLWEALVLREKFFQAASEEYQRQGDRQVLK